MRERHGRFHDAAPAAVDGGLLQEGTREPDLVEAVLDEIVRVAGAIDAAPGWSVVNVQVSPATCPYATRALPRLSTVYATYCFRAGR